MTTNQPAGCTCTVWEETCGGLVITSHVVPDPDCHHESHNHDLGEAA